MMRRYPVRSVLSERKMFSNGGMLPTSKPIESSMDRASGIMASSSPLIDAVSQEILAPFTGSAAAGAPSMTGAMPMAQGGIARFKNGGSAPPSFSGGSNYVIARAKQDRIDRINAFIKKGASMYEATQLVDNAAATPEGVDIGLGRDTVDEATRQRLTRLGETEANIRLGQAPSDLPTVAEAVIESAPPPTSLEELTKGRLTRLAETAEQLRQGTTPLGGDIGIGQGITPTGQDIGIAGELGEEPTGQDIGIAGELGEEPTGQDIGIGQGITPAGVDIGIAGELGEEPTGQNIGIGEGVTEAINSSTASQAKDSTFNLSDWVKQNPDKSTETAPGDVVNNSVDSIFSDALKSLEGKEFDVNKFKGEIEDLLPETKEDPQMEGLLIAMLGASIAGGTSENPLVNISNAVTKSMPAIINFKTKQKDKKNARDMTVAKLAIQTKIARENENRSAIRAVEAQKRGLSIDLFKAGEADRIAKDKEDRVTGNYMVVQNTTLPGNAFDPNASKDSEVTIPFNTKMNVTKGEAQRLQGMGIPLFEVGKPTVKLSDILGSTTGVSGLSKLTPTEINKTLKTEKTELFKFGSSDGIKADYYLPTALGLSKGIYDPFMGKQQWASIYLKYNDYRKKFERIGGKLNTLYTLADSGKLTGVDGLKERVGDSLRGLGSVPLAKQFADSLLQGKKLGTGGLFDVNARLVLAEIAPFILGESGKTISDTDRVRVAQALGYEASLEDGVMLIKGFNSKLLTSPEQVKAALREVTGVVNKYIELGDSEMQQAMIKYGRVTDEQTSQILQGISKERLSEMQSEVEANQAKGKIKIVDLDLTKGL